MLGAALAVAALASIPKVIWQTFAPPYDELPRAMHAATQSWRRLNPEYTYRYLDDNAQRQYVLRHGSASFVRAWNASRSGAARCDLWRALAVYREGGVYADIDTTLRTPLRLLTNESDDALSGIGKDGELHQWVLIYAAGHPLLAQLIEHAVRLDPQLPAEDIAGRRAMHYVASRALAPRSVRAALHVAVGKFRFEPGVYWMRWAGGRRHSVRVIAGNYLGGHVQFKYRGYVGDLKRANVTYWKRIAAPSSRRKPSRWRRYIGIRSLVPRTPPRHRAIAAAAGAAMLVLFAYLACWVLPDRLLDSNWRAPRRRRRPSGFRMTTALTARPRRRASGVGRAPAGTRAARRLGKSNHARIVLYSFAVVAVLR